MRTIKTRSAIKSIKVLDKSVSMSKRMKDSFVRAKERAEETQNPRNASPSEYAVDSVQDKTQGAAGETVYHVPNPLKNTRNSAERAKAHFQEVKRQLPKERQRAAEQTQKTAQKTKSNAEGMKKSADQARTAANEAKTAVKDAKQNLKQVRLEGRRTLREVKQNVRLDYRSGEIKKGFAAILKKSD